MQFKLTREYLGELIHFIEQDDLKAVKKHIHGLHPADIAEVFIEINVDQAKYIFNILTTELVANVLVELPEDQSTKLLAHYSSKEIATELIDSLESDDAVSILSRLEEEKKQQVLSEIKDVEQASDIVDILNYKEGEAGSLMAKELIQVNEDWTVDQCVKEIRKQAKEIDRILTIYVINQDEKLLGTLSLKSLLTSSEKTAVKRKYNKSVISVNAHDALEEVAAVMEKYDLVVVPVIDDIGRLVGRITLDDVLEFVKDEADKDYQIASGHSVVVESSDSVFMISRARLPWLLIGLFGGILGSLVIAGYEEDIKIYPAMAYFIPLIAAMAGNAGVQSSAIVVQALANNTMGLKGLGEKLGKEFYVSLLNGVACSVVIFLYNMIIQGPLNLGLTISLSLFAVIVFATLFGAITPLLLKRYNIDPAIATGPFITTANDILGLILYFFIGKCMYMV